ncbi:undecaprenyl-diphosphatase [Methylomagnum ishizawai]|uniref:undecaprenyl-diphosphate phosphatase n=1 Tax=Methylomagnum ishizawai TaxID=1760988 RepID=A0A1Y6CZE2_9GAMM|nr:phosphatase PAP2 family protein [Methylomagnum ishizawai]SMF95711.1 undecaprenyl-diphosphatase [Methylomagnum ishizawai]
MKLLSTIHQYDVSMFYWVMARKHLAFFTQISRWVSRSGDGGLYALFAVYLFYTGLPADRLFLTTGLAAFLLERPVYFVLKNWFKRNRPQDALFDFRSFIIPSDQFSFPSGHTSAAFLMATLLTYFHPALAVPAYLWASGVGLSRIFLGVHFPSDILVGATMGTSIALFSMRILGT